TGNPILHHEGSDPPFIQKLCYIGPFVFDRINTVSTPWKNDDRCPTRRRTVAKKRQQGGYGNGADDLCAVLSHGELFLIASRFAVRYLIGIQWDLLLGIGKVCHENT